MKMRVDAVENAPCSSQIIYFLQLDSLIDFRAIALNPDVGARPSEFDLPGTSITKPGKL
ncbi:MAG TPA: hypothetical protein VGE83_01110 [Terracidiphilus sp.]